MERVRLRAVRLGRGISDSEKQIKDKQKSCKTYTK